MSLPNVFQDVAHLEEVMSTPSEELCKELSELEGDILILGVGGKMGPTLARERWAHFSANAQDEDIAL